MTGTLEWFQCKGCGRRHRWQADIAGQEIQCACGAMVLCPTVEVDTTAPIDPASRGSTVKAAAREVEELRAAAGTPRTVHSTGLSPFTKALLWSLGAALGFTLLVFALMVQWRWYYVATVIWTPFSFWKFVKARRRWQGNRSLKRAFLEQVGADEDDDPEEEPA